ncbi:DegT/DnrJ/EryC1/StrS family aminotransferase [Nocardioides pantholopis]|uniref:DegT/DnrJ/EryC1/StrS family aminotransferase n=1 Tax=Nocardioides pantholopis TaxID=2483798 RepID=UPI0019D1C1E4|nr:DegT/DnrJ/EryC1/StrS family aminotransferase [Nocardioides pantholopis]
MTLPDSTTWPVITPADRDAVLGVLSDGALVSDRNEETAVDRLETEWAEYVRARHCIGVANGTIALELALEAIGVGPGDEVVVPALSFVATAMAVVNRGARPVFADIDPVTYNIDPDSLRAAITARTVAVMPVHLHGLPAPMDQVMEICQAHGLAVIEDAAQAHGATIEERHVGTFGSIGCFSLQATKNLPTCGEGGLLVTDDDAVASRLRQLRQFGEVIERGRPRKYLSHIVGHNAKLSSVQAAFTSSQLRRLEATSECQDRNVREFLTALEPLAGLHVPRAADPRARHVWHILRFRIDPGVAGLDRSEAGPVREALQRLLRAEGVPVTRYQLIPLSDQPAFSDLPPTTANEEIPVTRAVLADSFVLQRRHLDPSAAPLLRQYAEAFHKTWQHVNLVPALTASRRR